MIKAFVKNEIVFVIALIAAVATAFFNPPSLGWIDAIDFRTLALLFSLMGISEGLKGLNSILITMNLNSILITMKYRC